MTAPFVTGIRTTDDGIKLSGPGTVLHLRVQVAELWETIRVDAPTSASLASVKDAALAAFFPNGEASADFVAKVRGFEILNENESVERSGVRDGSTILLDRRRRRAVR